MSLRYIIPILALFGGVQAFNFPVQDSRAQAFKEEVLQRSLALKQAPLTNFLTIGAAPFAVCNETVACLDNSFQVCNRGRCQCEHPSENYYWGADQQCQVNAGRPCVPEEGSMPCIRNTECKPDPYSRTGHSCTCIPGMESDGVFCVKAYGEKCVPSDWWGGDDGCNYFAGQDCIQERCQCFTEPDQIYDPLQKRCVGREGFPCVVLDIGILGCITGSNCYKRNDLAENPIFGVCRKAPAANEVLYKL